MTPLATLYLCYFPLSEPLVETQVLAYLRGLAAAGHRVHLLTYEVERRSRRETRALRRKLAADGVSWHHRRYHKRPSLTATVWDVLVGIATGTYLVRRHRLDLVHVRTHVPGAMGLAVRRLTGCGLLFDIRGLMAEEYVDAGNWEESGVPYRLTKAVERRCIAVADGVVVLTERARALLFGDAHATPSGAPVVVIPSCVDVDSVVAQRPQRDHVRSRHGFAEEHQVLVYVGKFSTWYMAAEMADYFATWRRFDDRARFLVLTQSDPALITDELARADVPADAAVVTRVAPDEVGAELAAADVAISFIHPSPSKVASSPTKIGEYLAAGLPVVVGAGVGDTDDLVTGGRVGVVVHEHGPEAHRAAQEAVEALRADAGLGERAEGVARRALSLHDVGIPAYRFLYASVAERRAAGSPLS